MSNTTQEFLPVDKDRAVRQRSLVPPDALKNYACLVIGVGAIGRQVALQLAAMGATDVTIIDHDVVGIENLAVQGYYPTDIDQHKVKATAQVMVSLNPDCKVEALPRRFRRRDAGDLACMSTEGNKLLAVFSCVDSMEARKLIWETVRPHASLYVDGRMAAEVLRVLSISDPIKDDHYEKTLFSDEEATQLPCTGRSTIYSASFAASMMVGRFAAHLRRFPISKDTIFNLLTDELTVNA